MQSPIGSPRRTSHYFQSDALKREMLFVVSQHRDTFDKFMVDEVAKAEGRYIIHLPPYHCELNPIEMIWAQLGEAAKLKPLEVELKRLEDLSDAIVQDFSQMRKREEEMRDTNESTNSRVLYFSIFSMCCLLGLATWQVIYLRSFFKAKKLIE